VNLTQRYQTETSLSGSILFSHPTLKDPNFAQSIVFLSAHSKDQGTIGVILNRPIHKSLTELDITLDCGELADVPVFEGGPVEKDKLIIAAWEWLDSESSFKLYFGIDLEKTKELRKKSENLTIVCFLGHSGWSPGQLENELEDEAWLVSSLDHDLFSQMSLCRATWRKAVGGMSDELRLLADAPENPLLN